MGEQVPLRMPQTKPKYRTPGPGAYGVAEGVKLRFETPRASSFSSNLCKYDRAATGPLAESLRNAKNPAPNQYSKSAEQSLTVKVSAGRTKFGTSVREGPEGNVKMKTPAPGTYSTANLDKFSQGNRRSAAPHFSFGGNNVRASAPMYKSGNTPAVVGPASYRVGQGIGKQVASTRPSSPTWGMGTGTRDKSNQIIQPGFSPVSVLKTPGPGRYQHDTATGKQVLSTRATTPLFSQGTSTRPAMHSSSKTPGPGHYPVPSIVGKQSESRRPTSSAWKFGTSTRPSLDEGLVG